MCCALRLELAPLLALLLGKIAAQSCNDIDPDMVPCSDNSAQCCFAEGDGLQLTGSGTRAWLSALQGRSNSYARGKKVSIEVSTGNPYFDWAIEETGKATLEDFLEEACDCDEGTELEDVLPRPFNDASYQATSRSLAALENWDDFILNNQPECLCHELELYVRKDSDGPFWVSTSTCDDYSTGEECVGSCINGNGAQDTCDCASGWQGVSSSYCRSGCTSYSERCSSNPVWFDDSNFIAVRGDCSSNMAGDTCALSCTNGNSGGYSPWAICGCHGTWYTHLDHCKTCSDSNTRCSTTPYWRDSEGRVIARGSCSYTTPGYTCTAQCEDSTFTAQATCQCNGRWNAAVLATCAVDEDNGGENESETDEATPQSQRLRSSLRLLVLSFLFLLGLNIGIPVSPSVHITPALRSRATPS